jgi:hypothetical protein
MAGCQLGLFARRRSGMPAVIPLLASLRGLLGRGDQLGDTLSSSSHPSKRSGSLPLVTAVPASGWVPSIQTRISTAAASGSPRTAVPARRCSDGSAGRRA